MADVWVIFQQNATHLFAAGFTWMMLNTDLLFEAMLVFLSAMAALSAVYRMLKGKPIVDSLPERPLFLEKWTTGRSMRRNRTKLGAIRVWFYVAVTEEALVIVPHFPFTLLFLPEYFDLEWRIPRSKIKTIASQPKVLRERIVVDFLSNRGPEEVELFLRDSRTFQEVLAR